MDNLPELRDIHIPTDGISIFPLAYGWWVILAVFILSFMLIKLFIIIQKKSKKIYAKYLLNKFAGENNLAAAVAMSEILRRICVKKYPQAVSLSSKEWTDFLLSKTNSKLNEKSLLLLQNAPYVKNADAFETRNFADLRKFCYDWVGDNL